MCAHVRVRVRVRVCVRVRVRMPVCQCLDYTATVCRGPFILTKVHTIFFHRLAAGVTVAEMGARMGAGPLDARSAAAGAAGVVGVVGGNNLSHEQDTKQIFLCVRKCQYTTNTYNIDTHIQHINVRACVCVCVCVCVRVCMHIYTCVYVFIYMYI